MTVRTVTFDGTRLNQVQDYTGWSNYGGSGPGGSAEAPIAYQNGIAANRKLAGTALGGIQLTNAATIDMTAAANPLWFVKAIVSDSFDCNTSEGLRVGIGSAANASRSHNLAGSTAKNDAYLQYPAQGGYILTCIDPANTFWPIASSGSPTLTAIDWFGVQCAMITGQAKAENLAMDSIDIGQGLYLTLGTGADPEAKYTDYVAVDQNIVTNRWGCTSGAGSTVNAWCRLRAGGLIEFNDSTSIVNFKDGYHGAGLTGVLHELNNAASTWSMGATLIGEGKDYNAGAINTRPDYTITGTTLSGTYDLFGTIRNFNVVTLTSAVVADGASIECRSLVLAGAEFKNGTFKPNSLSGVAANDEEVFGSNSGFHDLAVVQAGVGHAFEITGDVTLSGMTFAGFGADTTNDAALFINVASGPVAVSLVGSQQPTYRLPGGSTATVTFPQSNTFTVTNVPTGGSLTIFDDENPGDSDLETILQGPTATTGADVGYSHGFTSNFIVVQFYKAGYEEVNVGFTLTNSTQSLDLSTLLTLEENL